MKALPKPNKNVLMVILSCCLIFLSLQLYLNFHELVTPDEFWFINAVYNKYRVSIPYQDFIPYKSVLGNYILLIPMLFSKDPFYAFVYVRNFISVYNVACLFICSLWLTRFFSPKAVVMSLVLLISSFFFLNISNDIRVDIFGYWICLISVLLLLENKYAWAGISLGIAFCISQKALWYLCASDLALVVCWLFYSRQRKGVQDVFIFNIFFVSIIVLYVGFWSYFSSFHMLVNSFFYEAFVVYKINLYEVSHLHSLGGILNRDILYLSLWFVTPLSLFVVTIPIQQQRRVFILIYTFAVMLLLINYKQPFGYFANAVIPALLLLYADFFTWVGELSNNKLKLYVNVREFAALVVLCALFLIYLKIIFFYLSYSIYLVCLLPIMLGFYIISIYLNRYQYLQPLWLGSFFLIILMVGVILSGRTMLPFPPKKGYIYQKYILNLVHDLVQDGSTYVAGIDLLFDKKQAISGNSFLEQNIQYLLHPNAELKKIMLASLDLDPDISMQKMIDAIKHEPVKLFIRAPFMDRLPLLLNYLMENYEHLWGNVYIYSPRIAAGDQNILIKFSGNYKLESEAPVNINGDTMTPQATVHLQQKYFHSRSNVPYRLKLIPDNMPELPQKLAVDIPPRLYNECMELNVHQRKLCVYLF